MSNLIIHFYFWKEYFRLEGDAWKWMYVLLLVYGHYKFRSQFSYAGVMSTCGSLYPASCRFLPAQLPISASHPSLSPPVLTNDHVFLTTVRYPEAREVVPSGSRWDVWTGTSSAAGSPVRTEAETKNESRDIQLQLSRSFLRPLWLYCPGVWG